jgi:DNA-binding LacI/PurR family transcriptional regulator
MNTGFAHQVIQAAVAAFNQKANFLFMDSSNNDPVLERQLAEHFIENGVAGLMIWPTSDDYNGEYFRELSKKKSLVLVDRKMLGVDLPIVMHDYLNCGKEVATCLLKEKQRKRVLILMDNIHLSSYQDMLKGLEVGATALGRNQDLTIINFPISRIIEKLIMDADTNDIYSTSEQIKRIIVEGDYDAVFCMHDQFIDYVLVQTGVLDAMPHVQIAHLREQGPLIKSLKFIESRSLEWTCDIRAMMLEASEALKQKVFFKKKMPGKKNIKLARTQ